MAMINYADKVALNQNSNIADINKVKADDMNELKNAFNNQVAQGWYKTGISPTLTFVSYDSTTYTGVVNSNLDLTSYLNIGMKIKFTQNSAIKYAFITAITSTQLTLFLGTDYSLNNSAISNSYYSMLKAPYGFPMDCNKWSLIMNDVIDRTQSSPTANTWYNLNNNKLDVPIGMWDLSYELFLVTTGNQGSYTITGYSTLSTANNSQSDGSMTYPTYISTLNTGISGIISFLNTFFH